MAAPKPIRMSSGMLSKTFRTIRAGVSRSRPACSCAKLAKSASFSTRAAAVMWRRGGRLSVGSTIQASIAKVGSASSLIFGKGFLQPSLSSIRRMPPHRQRVRTPETPDTCNRPRSEPIYLARGWRIDAVARRWDFEELLSDRLRGVLQVAQFLPCVMATARRQAGEQDMTLHLTRMKQQIGRVREVLGWIVESWSRKSEQGDKWGFCLIAGTLCPANQERPCTDDRAGTTHRPSRRRWHLRP